MLEYVTLYNLAESRKRRTRSSWDIPSVPGGRGRPHLRTVQDRPFGAGEEGHGGRRLRRAEEILEKALVYPENLGEGRLEGTKDKQYLLYLGLVKEKLGKAEEAVSCLELAELGDNEPAGAMYYYDQPADMILYKGLAKQKLGKTKEAHACFNKLMDYGERHLRDQVKNDFFAVSLPDFLIFEDDMDKRNKAHCYYLMGLANLGMGRNEKAVEKFDRALTYDYNHQNCRIYRELAKGELL